MVEASKDELMSSDGVGEEKEPIDHPLHPSSGCGADDGETRHHYEQISDGSDISQ